jgi:hypothetical protein
MTRDPTFVIKQVFLRSISTVIQIRRISRRTELRTARHVQICIVRRAARRVQNQNASGGTDFSRTEFGRILFFSKPDFVCTGLW